MDDKAIYAMVYATCLQTSATMMTKMKYPANHSNEDVTLDLIARAGVIFERALEEGQRAARNDQQPEPTPAPDVNPPSLDRWLELLRAAGVVLHMNEFGSFVGSGRLMDAYANLTLKEPRFEA